jgi:hypothetical protein
MLSLPKEELKVCCCSAKDMIKRAWARQTSRLTYPLLILKIKIGICKTVTNKKYPWVTRTLICADRTYFHVLLPIVTNLAYHWDKRCRQRAIQLRLLQICSTAVGTKHAAQAMRRSNPKPWLGSLAGFVTMRVIVP